MANDREIVEELLKRRGYKRHDGPISNPPDLPEKEYIFFVDRNGKQLIQCGPGRTGSEDCSMTFFFNEYGDFVEHSADHDPQEASDLDD